MGLCGIDGSLLRAKRVQNAELGYVGEIETVNAAILQTLLNSGTIPVVSSVALGDGHSLNVNADTAAAKIAASLGSEKLILMTDVQGILSDVQDPSSLLKVLSQSEAAALKKDGIVSKGMIPKIDCCLLALEAGVKRTHIIDGRLPHSLLIELFTDEGIGTMIE
jgi:acetylglutamate kinase